MKKNKFKLKVYKKVDHNHAKPIDKRNLFKCFWYIKANLL
jgi:hypothetical protein